MDKPGHRAGEYAIEAGHHEVAENVTDGGQHIWSHGLQYSVVLLVMSQRMLQASHRSAMSIKAKHGTTRIDMVWTTINEQTLHSTRLLLVIHLQL